MKNKNTIKPKQQIWTEEEVKQLLKNLSNYKPYAQNMEFFLKSIGCMQKTNSLKEAINKYCFKYNVSTQIQNKMHTIRKNQNALIENQQNEVENPGLLEKQTLLGMNYQDLNEVYCYLPPYFEYKLSQNEQTVPLFKSKVYQYLEVQKVELSDCSDYEEQLNQFNNQQQIRVCYAGKNCPQASCQFMHPGGRNSKYQQMFQQKDQSENVFLINLFNQYFGSYEDMEQSDDSDSGIQKQEYDEVFSSDIDNQINDLQGNQNQSQSYSDQNSEYDSIKNQRNYQNKNEISLNEDQNKQTNSKKIQENEKYIAEEENNNRNFLIQSKEEIQNVNNNNIDTNEQQLINNISKEEVKKKTKRQRNKKKQKNNICDQETSTQNQQDDSHNNNNQLTSNTPNNQKYQQNQKTYNNNQNRSNNIFSTLYTNHQEDHENTRVQKEENQNRRNSVDYILKNSLIQESEELQSLQKNDGFQIFKPEKMYDKIGEKIQNKIIEHEELQLHKKIYVRGIDFQASENDIKEQFERKAGQIKAIKLLRDQKQRFTGKVIIMFEDVESHDKALELNNTEMFGRQVAIQQFIEQHKKQ